MDWTRVKWSEANQVLDILQRPPERRGPDGSARPADYFARLRREGLRAEAVDFLAQALPRLEAVAWAARSVRDAERPDGASRPRERALRAALLWVQDPSETRRRAAFEAAQAPGAGGAEAMTALAVFFSGGSIAPAESAVVAAPRAVAGRFAATAIKVAASLARDRDAALDKALDLGETMARTGITTAA